MSHRDDKVDDVNNDDDDDDDDDDARRNGCSGEPICVQYKFSQTVPPSKGIPAQIRLLSMSKYSFVTVHGDCDILIWNSLRNVPPRRVVVDIVMDHITGVAISPTNSSIIALTFRLGTMHEAWTFDLASRTTEAKLSTGMDFHTVQFSPDGRLLAWISAGCVDVWETVLATHVLTIRESKSRTNGLPTARFAFTPDSSRMATVDRSGRLTSWDATTWSLVDESKAKKAWDDEGREAVQLVASKERVMVVSRKGQESGTWALTTWWPENGSRAELEMKGCEFGCVPGDGGFVATVQSDGGKLRIRDSRNGVCLDQSTQGIAKNGKSPSVVTGAITSDGRIMATQIVNGRTTLWQLVAAE
ncbi:hypothetical protein CH063_07006 [Colletotrichum higginsianum]|uniref:WD-40 repeat protein n=1 Tax=Colletotrichum higginsianum (strain IMI 349063) TaxID=759273 RepID=H1V4L2_COLHI|nr:WD-40 repeat protein [Colletotrichum higginsianum IMI 349063]OBR16451.1 WD-40 repeat protein [Colletotrichum higginsianum IMI 349063]CCF35164.1 hypothetical protein CH063_07006 [Colletotrichum higginsianum]